MVYQTGDMIAHFVVERVRDLQEIGAKLVEMKHRKTGTGVCFLDNGEENKVFSIAFRTLPEDDSGVFHILEHSTLCGSEKYPVKEPFVELIKSSLQTYLNAMTYPDRTVYPVSSRNEKDFLNLVEVYLDAVFSPKILTEKKVFLQEGWHIELENGKPVYKGVVFNEMKGALSQVDDLLDVHMQKAVFSDTPYGFNAGGDPASIPELTYEAFLDTYRRFYHPSHAMISLDGSVPLEKTLALVDRYLDTYDAAEPQPPIPLQVPGGSEHTVYYDVPREEPVEGRGYLACSRIVGKWNERTKIYAMNLILDVLAGSNETPLVRAVLESGLAQDVEVGVSQGTIQPTLDIVFRNVLDGHDRELMPLVQKTIAAELEKGLDRSELEASLNSLEFAARLPREPQGLGRTGRMLSSWTYGGDPALFLTNDAMFRELRLMLEHSAYDDLLREMFPEDAEWNVLHCLPSHTRGEELRREEDERLEERIARWSDAEKQMQEKETRKLLEWQKRPDSEEALAALPQLKISDLHEMPGFPDTDRFLVENVAVLHHPVRTDGIHYINLYFRVTDCSLEELTILSFMLQMLGNLPTRRRGTLELQRETRKHIGQMNTAVVSSSHRDRPDTCTPLIHVSASILDSSLDSALDLIAEILFETCFDQKDRIREFTKQVEEMTRQTGVGSGHVLASLIVKSRSTSSGAVSEAANGVSFIRWVRDFSAHFEERVESVIETVQKIMSRLGRRRMLAGVTSTSGTDLTRLLRQFPEGTDCPEDRTYMQRYAAETMLCVPSRIGFSACGGNLLNYTEKVPDSMAVVSQILSYTHLWNMIRVQGGAYGTGFMARANGSACFYSYRDPTPFQSLRSFEKSGAFLRKFASDREPLERFVISTIGGLEPLETPRVTGEKADWLYMKGYTKADRVRKRERILQTGYADLLECADLLDRMVTDLSRCVVAHRDMLKDAKGFEMLEM